MRPIHLNLAARPYRDYRMVWVVAGAMLAVTGLLLFANVRAGYHYLVSTRDTRAEIETLEAETRREIAMRRTTEEKIRRVDLKTLSAESRYVNAQLAERAFSWSLLLDRLERVVPNGVRLTTLNPSIDDKGVTRLSLSCIAKDGDGLVDILNRMMASPYFRNPFPLAEQTREDGSRQFTLEVVYMAEGLPAQPQEVKR